MTNANRIYHLFDFQYDHRARRECNRQFPVFDFSSLKDCGFDCLAGLTVSGCSNVLWALMDEAVRM